MIFRAMYTRLAAAASVILLVAVAGSAQTVAKEVNVQRSMVTRAELEAELVRIDNDVNSPGYSQALRDSRKQTADAIRARLANGDVQAGDLIKVSVLQNGAFSREYQVSPLRTITLPGGAEISVAGKLRSELSSYLTKEFSAYIVDPVVTATASIRIQFTGAVARNGFFWAPASDLLSTVLMDVAGGPARDAKLEKSEIKRKDKVVVGGEEFNTALREGRSLDALNVQAGDEIHIAEKPAGGTFYKVLGVASALGSVVYLVRLFF